MAVVVGVKALAVLVGLALSVLSLMAVVGAATDNGWARLLVALVVTLVATAFVADRALPAGAVQQKKGGLATDVVTIFLLALPLLMLGALRTWTQPLLVREGDRLAGAGFGVAARVAYAFGGVRPTFAAAPLATSSEGSPGGRGESDASPPAASPSASGASPAATPSGSATSIAPAPTATDDVLDTKLEHTPAEVFRAWAPSTVCIAATSRTGEGGGTGFVVDARGVIATNHHVVDGADAVRVKLYDGTWIDDVELLAQSDDDDTALLQVKTDHPLRAVPMGDSDKVAVGERILAIGNPLGLEYTLTDGLVSARRMLEGKPMIQMSVPVSPGNSGGPVFDVHGEAIGIATLQYGNFLMRAQNLNMATPINVLRRLVKDDYPARRRFGARTNGSTW